MINLKEATSEHVKIWDEVSQTSVTVTDNARNKVPASILAHTIGNILQKATVEYVHHYEDEGTSKTTYSFKADFGIDLLGTEFKDVVVLTINDEDDWEKYSVDLQFVEGDEGMLRAILGL